MTTKSKSTDYGSIHDEPPFTGLREVAKMAGPVVLASLSITVMGVVDTMMVGHLGKTEQRCFKQALARTPPKLNPIKLILLTG